jgi:hypothetical protein
VCVYVYAGGEGGVVWVYVNLRDERKKERKKERRRVGNLHA